MGTTYGGVLDSPGASEASFRERKGSQPAVSNQMAECEATESSPTAGNGRLLWFVCRVVSPRGSICSWIGKWWMEKWWPRRSVILFSTFHVADFEVGNGVVVTVEPSKLLVFRTGFSRGLLAVVDTF